MADVTAVGVSVGDNSNEVPARSAPRAATSKGETTKRSSKAASKAAVAHKSSKAAERYERRREKAPEKLCVKADRKNQHLSESRSEPIHSNRLHLLGLFPGGAGDQISLQGSFLPVRPYGGHSQI